MRAHGWQECRPALLQLEGADPADAHIYAKAMEKVWVTVSDKMRQRFHSFNCLGNHAAYNLAAMREFAALVRQQVRLMK